jgi:hypothetical protein
MSIDGSNRTELSWTSRSTNNPNGSIQFNSGIKADEEHKDLLERLLEDSALVPSSRGSDPRERNVSSLTAADSSTQKMAKKLMETIGSSNSTRSLLAASKKPSVFDCIKGSGPFSIACRNNENFAISGYGREIQIRYRQSDLFFIGYAVVVLDFVYKNKSDVAYAGLSESNLEIIRRVVCDTPDEKFEQILQDRESLEEMIVWLKSFAEPNAQYTFDKKGRPHMEQLFDKISLPIDIAKRKDSSCLSFRSIPEFNEIFESHGSFGELVLRERNLVSYFSGYC